MSTAAVSSSSIFQELQSFYHTRQTDLKQLGTALQSGNLSGAQQAYQSLAVLGDSGPFANSEPFGNSTRAQDFNALGEALQAGDLTRAQASFATLTANQGNFGSAAQATPAAVTTLGSTQPDAAPLGPPVANNSSIYQQLQAYRQQRASDLTQLGTDLQAGNLSAAQQDFATLTTLGQSGPNKNGQTFSETGRNQDFQAIGQALQSGDLAAAQSAFTTLQSTFGQQSQQAQNAISAYNNAATEIVINLIAPTNNPTTTPATPAPVTEPPVTEPPVNLPAATTQPATTEPASVVATATNSTAPEIVINLEAGSNTNATGSNTPEIVINLGAATNGSASTGSTTPEIVINLGAASNNNSSTAAATPEILIDLGQGTNSSSNPGEEVTINFGNGSGAPQISVGPIQGQNGSPIDQINIDANQNGSNSYQLIVNLLNSASTQTQSALSVSA